MMYLYIGTDRERARAKMNADVAKAAKGAEIIRITDAHALDDLAAALRGGGMFANKRVLVFENTNVNPEMREVLLDALEEGVADPVFIFEEKLLVAEKKRFEKHAEKVEKFDAPKKERDGSIFAIANALRAGDKKALWVSYMEEIAKGGAPEAIHGVLFWGAKDAFLKSGGKDSRTKRLVAELAALPHEARRRGEDLEYALERFVLSTK
jgi:DNA polymerase III delta subunit